jgi:hypothetical protein
MKNTTRNEIWSILNEAFGLILNTLQNTVPSVMMQAGQHQNDAFLFWAYAEYSVSERVIVISFNIQVTGKKLRVWGDIAKENGVVLKDVMNMIINDGDDAEAGLGSRAREFASDCQKETKLIEMELK